LPLSPGSAEVAKRQTQWTQNLNQLLVTEGYRGITTDKAARLLNFVVRLRIGVALHNLPYRLRLVTVLVTL